MSILKFFSVQDANEAITVIRPILAEIQEIRTRILASRPELWDAMQRAAGNGGSAELTQMTSDFEHLDSLVHRILDTGAEIKDLASGLLDFRAQRNGSEVYLCWKMDENEVLFWHDLNAGFGGRQPIATF
ncbi:MAG TPA: DUF2203 domain-containing protein [Anaerolineales bacterium]|nr:DUF2203 domain-containing protein [Anaerolineales bacterium]